MADCRRDDPLLVALTEVLQPYPWRRFRPERLVRYLLAAKDRHELSGLLAGVPGAAVGRWDELKPVGRDDPRVATLVRFLQCHHWTELSLTGLCDHLLAQLDVGR